MRDQLKVQELMDVRLNQRDEELRQLCSQSQADGAQLAALSLQVQELISSVETRAKVVSSAIGFLPHSHSFNFSFSNLHTEHLFYFPYLSLFSLLIFFIFFKFTPVKSKKATAIFKGTNGRGTI